MYSEIGTIKKMTVAQFDNDINLFCDSIKSVKLQIDSKDPNAYTDKAFVRDIFFRSRMSCFLMTSSPSLLLLKSVGR
jgi:hypothetical protein